MIRRITGQTVKLLRWSEKYTKTDMVYLSKGGFWLGLGQAAASLSSFILAVLFANLVSEDTYGTYKYVLSLVAMLAICTLPGINTPLAQGIARGFEGSFRTALRKKILWGFFGLAASAAIALYYLVNGNQTLAVSFFIASAFIPFMDPLSLYNTYLQSKKLFQQAVIYYGASQIIATVAIAAAIFFSGNLFLILFAYFASWTGMRFFFHRITVAQFPPNTGEDPDILEKGKHLTLLNVLSTVVANLDSLLIFHFLGAAPVAAYSLATAPIDQLRSLFRNVSPLALPKLTQRPIREINVLLYRRLAFLAGTGAALALLYLLAAPLLFAVLFPKYIDAVPVSVAFAFTLTLQLPLAFFAAVTQSKIDLYPKSWFYAAAIPQSILIISAVVLVPVFGLWGVVASVYLQLGAAVAINVIQWRSLSLRHE